MSPPTVSEPPPPQSDRKKPDPRRKRLLVLTSVVILAGAGYGAWWFSYARYFESTDDAYVSGDVVAITTEVAGSVTDLKVDDTQTVRQGQTLLELDPADAQVAMESSQANLARAVRHVRTLFAQARELRAQIVERETDLKRSQDDYGRREQLISDGAVSAEELSHTKDTISQQRASLTAAREQLNATLAQIEGTTVQTHPEVLAAAAAVRDAALALSRTRIVAPVPGVIARRSVEIGQRVAPGTPLMAVVPLQNVWVDANFKEVQLKKMRVGQPVSLRADVYGGEIEYHGKLVGLSAGSGSAFALLPAQNASGNWIKIVQRVPVRIVIDQKDLNLRPLRIGLSMNVKVDVHDTASTLVAGAVRNEPLPRQAGRSDDPAVQLRIRKIIEANAATTPAEQQVVER